MVTNHITKKLFYKDHNFIAYHKFEGKHKPGIIFLGGYLSDMNGTKACAIENFCKEQNYSFIKFDYFGHGQSSGNWQEGTISIWLENVLTVIDRLTSYPQILIGSSLGGWLMLLAALNRPDKIKGLIGIAPAPDFTKKLIWNKISETEKNKLDETGLHMISYKEAVEPLYVTKKLIIDGEKHLILNDKIKIEMPIHLIHGMQDKEVPFKISIELAELLTSDNINIHLIKNGDHRLSTAENISLICEILKKIYTRACS